MLLKSTMTNGVLDRTLTNLSELSVALWDKRSNMQTKTPRDASMPVSANVSIIAANKNMAEIKKRIERRNNVPLAAHIDRNYSHSQQEVKHSSSAKDDES